jgi:hypothetical protein
MTFLHHPDRRGDGVFRAEAWVCRKSPQHSHKWRKFGIMPDTFRETRCPSLVLLFLQASEAISGVFFWCFVARLDAHCGLSFCAFWIDCNQKFCAFSGRLSRFSVEKKACWSNPCFAAFLRNAAEQRVRHFLRNCHCLLFLFAK